MRDRLIIFKGKIYGNSLFSRDVIFYFNGTVDSWLCIFSNKKTWSVVGIPINAFYWRFYFPNTSRLIYFGNWLLVSCNSYLSYFEILERQSSNFLRENNMIDDIGLGAFLANIILWVLAIITSFGSIVFLWRKKKLLSFLWLSIWLNITFYFYFLGADIYWLQILLIFIWPAVNIVFIAVWIWNSIISVKKLRT